MKKNQTRRALLLSCLSLLLCVSMLVGSTFAWFTDSVVSANNIIKSGNLDVVLEYKTNWNDEWKVVESDTKLFAENAKFEPGYTEVVFLRVSNAGSLALKYEMKVDILSETTSTNMAGEEFKLSDYLEIGTYTQSEYSDGFNYADILFPGMFGTREAALSSVSGNMQKLTSFTLKPEVVVLPGDETAQVAVLVLNMPETVGNEANHKTGVEAPKINLGVTLLATQHVHENDSFGPEYDEDADYPTVVYDNEGLNKALEEGKKNIKLASGTYTFPASKLTADTTLTCEPGTVFEGSASLNIKGATVNGATFSNEGKTIANQVTVNGTFENCTFRGRNILSSCYAGETVVFKNCVFDGDVYGVHFDSGANDVTFIGCTFSGFNTFGGALTKLTLDGCTFKALGNSNYNGINMWGDTDLIGCTFVFDGSVSTEWCDLVNDNKTVTFTNCFVSDGTNTQSIQAWGGVGDFGTGNTIIYN